MLTRPLLFLAGLIYVSEKFSQHLSARISHLHICNGQNWLDEHVILISTEKKEEWLPNTSGVNILIGRNK